MQPVIITLDGFSSCGKSTLARQLASELNYVFIDSGAMYRAIALYFIRNQADWNNQTEVVAALKEITLEFKYNPLTGNSDMYLNNENVETLMNTLYKMGCFIQIRKKKDLSYCTDVQPGEYQLRKIVVWLNNQTVNLDMIVCLGEFVFPPMYHDFDVNH